MLTNKPFLQICRILMYATALLKIVRAQTPMAVCMTGPTTQDSNSIFVNGRQYISDRGEVECNGFITNWSFCHYVIGFRDLEMEIWAGVWRLDDDIYSLVGLNVITMEPPGYEGDTLRCVDYEVPANEWIEAQDRDYIGFFLPDNGLFVASASGLSDPDHKQMQRSNYGYEESFNSSEVELAATSSGRALLRATIDPNAKKPDNITTSLPSPSPTQTPQPSSPSPTQTLQPGVEDKSTREEGGPSITEIVIPTISVVVILVLLVVITVLVVLLKRRSVVNAALEPLALPIARTVDATNPTTGTSDNGSVLYEAIYSQAYLQARDLYMKNDTSYSMIANPAYQKGDTLTHDSPGNTLTLTSPPVTNPTYISTSSTQLRNVRYPKVVFRSKRTATHPISPSSPPPTIPAPQCPAPPPPPPPYALTLSSAIRPPTLTLHNPPGATGGTPLSMLLSPPCQSPPSPYSNPYKSPRPQSPDSMYETVIPPIHPLTPPPSSQSPPTPLSGSSTMTRSSDQTETRSTSAGSGTTDSH